MTKLFLRTLAPLLLAVAQAGCVSSVLEIEQKAVQPIPASVVSLMSKRSMTPSSPILVRIFKQESELEIWKRDRTGKYALLKTYPMCRWSGKLGPKKQIGDRQAPEGFYHVEASMLNPNSKYYLSFNLGYPNKLEAALGYSGEALMVHGACSSSGCYALTDEGVAEIYAIAREALRGGQSVFQVQAYPFRMTPQNMAKNRTDPNYAFWQNLKIGYDSFELTRREPKVGYCGRAYAFGDSAQELPTDPMAACTPDIASADPLVASKQASDSQQIDALTTSGTALTAAHSYVDGGMNPVFRKMLQRGGAARLSNKTSLTAVPVSRPDAALADPHSPGEKQ